MWPTALLDAAGNHAHEHVHAEGIEAGNSVTFAAEQITPKTLLPAHHTTSRGGGTRIACLLAHTTGSWAGPPLGHGTHAHARKSSETHMLIAPMRSTQLPR